MRPRGASSARKRPQVEARSLSVINELAANPPQYPHYPEARESLTLYISRVPGTRDIILSTLKPQKKNVTGEDVANSLYYVHFDLPTDELLAAPAPPRRLEDATSPRSSSESARSAIPRKPLPASARVARPENNVPDKAVPVTAAPALAPVTIPELTHQLSDNLSLAQIVSSPQSTEPHMDGYPPNPMFLDRRPDVDPQNPELPPRPPPKEPAATSTPANRRPFGPRPLTTPENELPLPPRPGREDRPSTPTQYGPRPMTHEPARYTSPTRAASGPMHSTPSPTKTGRRPSFMPFTLTLIRRDPLTGGQWNIGKVSSFQTNIPTPDMADPSLNPDDMGSVSRAQKIDIRIETSGYAKYRDLPTLSAINAYRPGSGHSFAQAMKGLTQPGGGTGMPPSVPLPISRSSGSAPDEGGFSRQVVMAYSKSWSSNIRSAFHRRERAGSSADADDMISPSATSKRGFHKRAGSASTAGSGSGDLAAGGGSTEVVLPRDTSPPPIATQPSPGLKPKGYVFVSPWDGQCEFRTSASGRSLKCQHVLDPKSPRFNPKAIAQNVRDAQTVGRSRGDELTAALAGAKPVSELRFNLPHGEVLRTPGLSSPPSAAPLAGNGSHGQGQGHGSSKRHHWGETAQQQLQGHFTKLMQHLEARSSDEEDEEDDDDFLYDDDAMNNLGKENAGGGSKGNRAKLGKLIVHDEGLKMLDLVVAANVGVWWTTWERAP